MSEITVKPINLSYNVFDRSAKKIASLIKMANLNFQIEEIHEDVNSNQSAQNHILQTPSG